MVLVDRGEFQEQDCRDRQDQKDRRVKTENLDPLDLREQRELQVPLDQSAPQDLQALTAMMEQTVQESYGKVRGVLRQHMT